MAKPRLERNGDAFFLAWDEMGIGFAVDRLRDTSSGIRAELSIESITPGRTGHLGGPVSIDLLAMRGQSEVANFLAKRVNSQSSDQWQAMVVQACTMVSAAWRKPAPIVDLAVVERKPVDYLIDGLVPARESTLFYGDGESGKSMLALRVAFSIATGLPLPWGPEPKRTEQVLYLDWETTPETISSRLHRLCDGMNVPVPTIHYRQCFRPLADDLGNIRADIARLKVGTVVVDSIGFACVGSLTEDQTAREVMGALRGMGAVTRIVVAHVSRNVANDARGRGEPFGSKFFWNGMRSGIEVRRSEDTPAQDSIDLGLFHRKSNDGRHYPAIGLQMTFEGRDGPICVQPSDLHEVSDLAVRTPVSVRLREMLKRGAKSTPELAEALEEKEETIKRTLNRMPDAITVEPGGGRGHPAVWGLSSAIE